MKKIWRLFAALSLLTVFAFSSCAIYIGGGYHGKYYNLECLNDIDSDYYNKYLAKSDEQREAMKDTWDSSKFKYDKKTYQTESQVYDFLKQLGAGDSLIDEIITTVNQDGKYFNVLAKTKIENGNKKPIFPADMIYIEIAR